MGVGEEGEGEVGVREDEEDVGMREEREWQWGKERRG